MEAERLNRIIFDFFKIPANKIEDSLTQKDIPEWDSMNYLLFIAELEKQFNVSFNMDEILNTKSLGSIKDMLRLKGIKI